MENETQEYKDLTNQIQNNVKYQKKRLSKRIVIVFVVVIWTFSVFMIGSSVGRNDQLLLIDDELYKIIEVYNIMKDEWFFSDQYENVKSHLVDNALYGMTNNLTDIHTSYLSEEEVLEFTTDTDHNFVGIGVQYISFNDHNIITNVFPDSPAKHGGVLAGDIIIAIDGENISNYDTDAVKEKVLGNVGESLVLTVLRGSELVDLELLRNTIGSVFGHTYDNVGYIEIHSFGTETGAQLRSIVEDFVSKGIKDFIVSLRGNPGGYLSACIDTSEVFLDTGSVVMKEVHQDGTYEVHTTKKEPVDGVGKVIILVDSGSASASEVFTLAMRENYNDVQVIGTETYGKGTMQQTRYLQDDSAIKFTTAAWQSGNGVMLIDEGIKPDIEVSNNSGLDLLVILDEEEELNIEYETYDTFNIIISDCLEYIGYENTDIDGYFGANLLDALNRFEKDNNLELTTDTITNKTYTNLASRVLYTESEDPAKDLQLNYALDTFK